MIKNQYETHVICNICNEDLGIDRPNWGVEHLAKYSDHMSYRDERIPLVVKNTQLFRTLTLIGKKDYCYYWVAALRALSTNDVITFYFVHLFLDYCYPPTELSQNVVQSLTPLFFLGFSAHLLTQPRLGFVK